MSAPNPNAADSLNNPIEATTYHPAIPTALADTLVDFTILLDEIRASIRLVLEIGATRDFQSPCREVISSLGGVRRLLAIAIDRHGDLCAQLEIPPNLRAIAARPGPDGKTTVAYLCAELSAMLRQVKAVVDLLLFDGNSADYFENDHSTVMVSLWAVYDLLGMASATHERLWREVKSCQAKEGGLVNMAEPIVQADDESTGGNHE